MTTDFHLDFETFSPVDIGLGEHQYAVQAEILVAVIARGEETPVAWSVVDPNPEFVKLFWEALDTKARIWAHNAAFEFAICKHQCERTFGIEPPDIEQWHCTAALCRLGAIPSSLAKAGEFLQIEMPKDEDGKRLIRKFSVPRQPTKNDPRTRILPTDDPEDFQRFVDYCVRDVEAERQILHKIRLVNQPKPGHDAFVADLRMNDRGIPVNVHALQNAQGLLDEYSTHLVPRFLKIVTQDEPVTLPVTKLRKEEKVVDISGGFEPSKRELMLAWLKTQGFTGDDLQQDTVGEWVENPRHLTQRGKDALNIYSMVGGAAVKKVQAMLDRAQDDGRIRGAFIVFGAERTHRWTGSGIQPQNFARPTVGCTEQAYRAIEDGWTWQDIEAVYGDLYQVIGSSIRHFIEPKGMFLQADYASIEARVAPWLSKEESTLELFRKGVKLYEWMAGLIFHKPADQVTKDERFIGKQAILGCGFSMGRLKFKETCAGYGFTPPAGMVEEYKPRHRAFVERSIRRTKMMVEMKFRQKEIDIPDKFLTREYLESHTMKDWGWTTLVPQTQEEWEQFTFDDLADRAVSAWREANPCVVAMWRALETEAKKAIRSPGERFTAGRVQLMFIGADVLGYDALAAKLPSGHYLFYPKARIDEEDGRIRFWGIMPGTKQWGWCNTYGGKLLENLTQACAGDIMREGMMNAEREGYEAVMLVHDEILCEQQPGQTHERLCELLCAMPDWAEGLPLAAEGSTIPFYKK